MVLASPREWSAGRCWPGIGRALSVTVERLSEHAAGNEGDVGGALREAAHEIRVPLRAEGNVDANAVSVLHQRILQIATYAVEHLELVAVARDVLLFRPAFGFVDDRRIVRGDARVV